MQLPPMRRFKQLLGEETCREVLGRASNAVLGMNGTDGYPYAVPLSFAYVPPAPAEPALGCVYFHCAPAGHKLDCLRADCRASMTVVDEDLIVQDEFTSYFRSVMAFGRVAEVDDPAEADRALRLLIAKYSPDVAAEAVEHEMGGCARRASILRLDIEALSGKEARELVEKRS